MEEMNKLELLVLLSGWLAFLALLVRTAVRDRGGRVIALPSAAAWDNVKEAFAAVGVYPLVERNTTLVKRALYPGGLVINWSQKEFFQRLRIEPGPKAAIRIPVARPLAEAQTFSAHLAAKSWVSQPEDGVPADSLVFVTAPQLLGDIEVIFSAPVRKLGGLPFLGVLRLMWANL
jgi:hypothetical protein